MNPCASSYEDYIQRLGSFLRGRGYTGLASPINCPDLKKKKYYGITVWRVGAWMA